MGMEVFMDVGAVTPESIQSALATRSSGDAPPSVNVSVLYRFAMTIQTAMQIHQQLTQMIEATKSQIEGAAKTAQTKQGA